MSKFLNNEKSNKLYSNISNIINLDHIPIKPLISKFDFSDNKSIESIIKERNITSLYHFTQIENLESILIHGLIPVNDLDRSNKYYKYNDALRLDNHKNAICVSISFPNYKMFFKYRKYDFDNWCVLELDPSILYKKDCLFCLQNAASKDETKIEDKYKKGGVALDRLFYDEVYRKNLNLEPQFTTNPQAEVLVLDTIEPNYIKSINFYTDKPKFNIAKYKNYNFYQDKELFTYRYDYAQWQD